GTVSGCAGNTVVVSTDPPVTITIDRPGTIGRPGAIDRPGAITVVGSVSIATPEGVTTVIGVRSGRPQPGVGVRRAAAHIRRQAIRNSSFAFGGALQTNCHGSSCGVTASG